VEKEEKEEQMQSFRYAWHKPSRRVEYMNIKMYTRILDGASLWDWFTIGERSQVAIR
jgi:hypothetical protein